MAKYSKEQQLAFAEELAKLSSAKPKITKQPIVEPVKQTHACIISVGYKCDNFRNVIEKTLVGALGAAGAVETINVVDTGKTIYGGIYYGQDTGAPNIEKKSDFDLERWYNSHTGTLYDTDVSGAYVNNDKTCIVVKIKIMGEEIRFVVLNTNNLTTGVQKRQIHDTKVYTYIEFAEPVKITLETYIDRGFKTRSNKYEKWTIVANH